jgi:hypothetical protein
VLRIAYRVKRKNSKKIDSHQIDISYFRKEKGKRIVKNFYFLSLTTTLRFALSKIFY